jgi:hypothetical protein
MISRQPRRRRARPSGVRTTAALAITAALMLDGCAAGPPDPPRPAAVTTTARPTLQEVVADTHATLSAVSVRPGPAGPTVRAWWVVRRGGRTFGAVVTGTGRMTPASYTAASYRTWAAGEPRAAKPSAVPGMSGLLPSDVLSVRDGTRAQVGGHDGATLLPFERVARSVDGGPWETFDVPRTRGRLGYTAGQVVLPDGRLLVLLDAWSDDRPGRASPVWHGLWVSDGGDWAAYRPWRPSFTPALPAGGRRPRGPLVSLGAALDPGQASGPVVWVTTANRLYVSTDGARSFQEVPARPAT